MDLTDVFRNFRASCINSAKDIRDFTAGRNNFDLGEDDLKQLDQMTERLNEQFESLNYAWRALLKYGHKFPIEVDRDETFEDIHYAKEHATRMVEMAFCISDQLKQTNVEKYQVADVVVEEDTYDLALAEEMVPQDDDIQIEEASKVGEARQITDHTEIVKESMDDENGQ